MAELKELLDKFTSVKYCTRQNLRMIVIRDITPAGAANALDKHWTKAMFSFRDMQETHSKLANNISAIDLEAMVEEIQEIDTMQVALW